MKQWQNEQIQLQLIAEGYEASSHWQLVTDQQLCPKGGLQDLRVVVVRIALSSPHE
jgi:hypothetical protein